MRKIKAASSFIYCILYWYEEINSCRVVSIKKGAVHYFKLLINLPFHVTVLRNWEVNCSDASPLQYEEEEYSNKLYSIDHLCMKHHLLMITHDCFREIFYLKLRLIIGYYRSEYVFRMFWHVDAAVWISSLTIVTMNFPVRRCEVIEQSEVERDKRCCEILGIIGIIMLLLLADLARLYALPFYRNADSKG